MSENPALLPANRLVNEAYRLAWRYRIEYLKISWLWLILMICALPPFILLPLQGSVFTPTTSNPADISSAILLSLAQSFIIVLLGVSPAVSWHRLILRGEKPAGMLNLRFDSSVLAYLKLALFLLVLESMSDLIKLMFSSASPSASAISGLLQFILSIVVIIYTTRLSVLLPARALDNNSLTKTEAMKRTKGNFWRLALGGFACFLPVIIAVFLISLLTVFIPDLMPHTKLGGAIFTLLIITICMICVVPVYLAFLSLSYRYFFENEPVIPDSPATA